MKALWLELVGSHPAKRTEGTHRDGSPQPCAVGNLRPTSTRLTSLKQAFHMCKSHVSVCVFVFGKEIRGCGEKYHSCSAHPFLRQGTLEYNKEWKYPVVDLCDCSRLSYYTDLFSLPLSLSFLTSVSVALTAIVVSVRRKKRLKNVHISTNVKLQNFKM